METLREVELYCTAIASIAFSRLHAVISYTMLCRCLW